MKECMLKFKVGDKVKVVSGQDAHKTLVKNVVASIIEVRDPSNLHGKEITYVLSFANEKKFIYLNFPHSELELIDPSIEVA